VSFVDGAGGAVGPVRAGPGHRRQGVL